jgi:hypothetical protein
VGAERSEVQPVISHWSLAVWIQENEMSPWLVTFGLSPISPPPQAPRKVQWDDDEVVEAMPTSTRQLICQKATAISVALRAKRRDANKDILIEVIEELGKATTQEMSESVLLTQSYINILLQDLEAEGRIEKTGEFRMRRVVWRLK